MKTENEIMSEKWASERIVGYRKECLHCQATVDRLEMQLEFARFNLMDARQVLSDAVAARQLV